MVNYPARGTPDWDDDLQRYIDGHHRNVQNSAVASAAQAEAARAVAVTAGAQAIAAQTYIEGLVIEDLGTTDSQSAALIQTKGSLTEQALTAMLGPVGPVDSLGPNSLALTRLERETQTRLARFNAEAHVRAENAAATVFVEDWADATDWTPSASNAFIGGGRAWGSGGYAKAINIAAGATALIRATMRVDASPSGKSAYIGVNNNAPGAAPAPADANGIYWGMTSGNAAVYRGANVTDHEAAALKRAAALPEGNYLVTIAIDETWIMGSVQPIAGGQAIYTSCIPRANMPNGPAINNVALSAGAGSQAGVSFGPVVVNRTLAPPTASTARVVNGHTLFGAGRPILLERETTLDPSTSIRHFILLPGTYDPRLPAPVVNYLHWSLSENGDAPFTDARVAGVRSAYEAAGYIVCASDNGPSPVNGGTQDNYGNQYGMDDYCAIVEWTRRKFSTGPVFLQGDSLGGEFVQNLLAFRKLGGIAAAISVSPSTDLLAVEQLAGYGAAIRAAYGATDTADFLVKVKGYDSGRHGAIDLRGVPQRFYVASDDVITPTATHVTPVVNRIAPYVPEVSVVTKTGGHLAAALYDGADFVAFFERHR